MDFSVIIVMHNSEDVISECLNSVLECDSQPYLFEVIVVDNGSSDNSCKIVQRFVDEQHNVSLIRNTNVGFGVGVNLGAQNALGALLLILNPDVRLQTDFFEIVAAHFRNQSALGILAPQLLNLDGTVQTSIRRWPSITALIGHRIPVLQVLPLVQRHVDSYLMRDHIRGGLTPVPFAIGACLVIRASVFGQVGGFRQEFFLYFEDSQLCKDVWDSGYMVLYVPEVRAIHEHKRQSLNIMSAAFRHHLRSAVRFYRLNPSFRWMLPFKQEPLLHFDNFRLRQTDVRTNHTRGR